MDPYFRDPLQDVSVLNFPSWNSVLAISGERIDQRNFFIFSQFSSAVLRNIYFTAGDFNRPGAKQPAPRPATAKAVAKAVTNSPPVRPYFIESKSTSQ